MKPEKDENRLEREREAERLLRAAQQEIETLRRHVSILVPKADAYDAMLTLTRMIPQGNVGYGVDLHWEINRFLENESQEVPVG